MRLLKLNIICVLTVLAVYGCTSIFRHQAAPNVSKVITNRIAVMPVKNHKADAKAGQILREKIISELFFKGYPRIASSVIDEKLSSIYGKSMNFKQGDATLSAVGEQLGADALLYCTLNQFETSYRLVYAPTTVSISLELKSLKTGATLWKNTYEAVKRCYGITKKQLELETVQIYELALQEALEKAMETLPDGPNI